MSLCLAGRFSVVSGTGSWRDLLAHVRGSVRLFLCSDVSQLIMKVTHFNRHLMCRIHPLPQTIWRKHYVKHDLKTKKSKLRFQEKDSTKGQSAQQTSNGLFDPLTMTNSFFYRDSIMCSKKTILSTFFLLLVILFSACEQAHITPPLTFQMRSSAIRGGVVQITNRAAEHLECKIFAINKERNERSKIFRCVIKSGEMQEIGFRELDGWYIDPGEKVVISVVGYVGDMQVIFNNDGTYTYGPYSNSD